MEYNLFIIPITMIITELLKQYIPSRWVPLFSVALGLIAGLAFGAYYQQDLFVHGVQGLIYGATATGIYRTGEKLSQPTGANE
ncbi:TPA: hypothetical protein ACGO1T_000539 [Streptococcus suis]